MEYVQPIVGFFTLLFLGAIFSTNIKKIKIKYVINAIIIQFVLAFLLLKWTVITDFFALLSRGVLALTTATDSGVAFVFGYLATGAPGAPFEIVEANEKLEKVSKLFSKNTHAVLVRIDEGKYHIITKHDLIDAFG